MCQERTGSKRPDCGHSSRQLSRHSMKANIALTILVSVSGCERAPEQITTRSDDSIRVELSQTRGASVAGQYVCTVAEKASIQSLHLEGANSPVAVAQNNLAYKFLIAISETEQAEMQLIELPYNGPGADPTEWQTQNSILHIPYLGDGQTFKSTDSDDLGSFVLGPTVHTSPSGDLAFYHSGFEWAGGEDTHLSIRWGRCRKQ